ncbi:hypothetical protein P9112_013554 [Eukaryota sp. TZLM1-RC]
MVHEPGDDNHWADMLSRNIDLDLNEGTPSICSINRPDTLLSNYEIPPLDDDSDSDFEDIPSKNLSKFDSIIPLLDDIKLKNIRLQEKREEAERHQSLNTPTSVDNTNSRSIVFNIGDYVLRKTKQNNKLHGSWNGPFLVIDHPSNSTLLLKNLTTGTELMAAKKDCKIYNAENPQDIEFLKTVAAGDAEKHVIEKILSEYNSDSGSFSTVQWFGGETTEEPLHSVKHSEAYKLFSRNNKKIGKRTTSQRKSTSNNSAPCKRPGRSTRIRK